MLIDAPSWRARGSRVGIRVAAGWGVRAGEVLEAPPFVARHAASRERLGETLPEDPRRHGLREGADSRDRILRQGSRNSVRGAHRRLNLSRVGGRP